MKRFVNFHSVKWYRKHPQRMHAHTYMHHLIGVHLPPRGHIWVLTDIHAYLKTCRRLWACFELLSDNILHKVTVFLFTAWNEPFMLLSASTVWVPEWHKLSQEQMGFLNSRDTERHSDKQKIKLRTIRNKFIIKAICLLSSNGNETREKLI